MRRYVLSLLQRTTHRADYERADDLVSGYLAKAIEKNWLDGTDQKIRKFRAYLQDQLRKFVYDRLRYDAAQRRGGGVAFQTDGLDDLLAADADPSAPEFEEGWMHVAMRRATEELRRRDDTDAAFLIELLAGGENDRSNEFLMGVLDLDVTPVEFRHIKSRVRRRFATLLAFELRQVVADDEAFEEEWNLLKRYVPWLQRPESD